MCEGGPKSGPTSQIQRDQRDGTLRAVQALCTVPAGCTSQVGQPPVTPIASVGDGRTIHPFAVDDTANRAPIWKD